MERGVVLRVIELLVLTVIVGVVLHAPLTVYFGSIWPSVAVELKAWKELLLLGALLLTLLLIHRRRLWSKVFSKPIIQLCLAFGLLHLVLIPFSSAGLLSIIAGLMIDLRFIVLFALCYTIAIIDPTFKKQILVMVGIGASIIVGFGLLQLTVLPDDALRSIGYSKETIRPFTTIDQNDDFIRIQSTTRGPNPLGAMIIIYLSLLAAIVLRYRNHLPPKQWVGGAVGAISTVAVLVSSYSRSAMVGAAVALAIVFLYSVALSKKIIISLGVIGILALGGLWAIQSTDFYSNVVLHEDPESSVVKKSNTEHIRSLVSGTKRVVDEPLGEGVGSTGSASLYDGKPGPTIENQYLFIAHEVGWVGLALFLGLFGLVLYQLWVLRHDWMALATFSSGVGLALVGLLLPVWVDETVALIWWALAGVIIGAGYERYTSQQKTTRTTSVRR